MTFAIEVRTASVTEPSKLVRWTPIYFCLVPRNAGVDVRGPRVDAAFDIEHVAEALRNELLRRGPTASAMMAMQHDLPIFLEARDFFACGFIEDFGLRELGFLALVFGAHVVEIEFVAAVDHLFQLLHRQRFH